MKSSFFGRFQDWLSEWDETKTRQVLIVLLAVLCGTLLALISYIIIKAIILDFFPRPPTIDYSDPVQAGKLIATDPVGAYWAMIVSWILGALIGAYASTRIAKFGQAPAWINGVVLLAFYLLDLFGQPHTLLGFFICTLIVGVFSYAGGWLGSYVTLRKRMNNQVEA